jgi:RNA polymerase sigma-70 factor (ECF subfamily)
MSVAMSSGTPHLRICPPPSSEPAVADHALPVDTRPLTIERLFVEHAGFVATVVLRVLGRDHEVDDVVQEVFLDAMSGLRSIQNPAAVRGWLKTIAVRKASRHLRKRRLRAFLGLERDCCYEHLADPSCGPEERALLSRVYRQLDTLPVGDRVAWTLRHVDGEPLDSVAALCGCSLATVKRRISAAQAVLERRLRHG